MRASCAEKGMPRWWHRDSSEVISVLLLLALSITIAMICVNALAKSMGDYNEHTLPTRP